MPKPGQAAEAVENQEGAEGERDAAAEALPEELDSEPIETRDDDADDDVQSEEDLLGGIDLRDLNLDELGVDLPIPRIGELFTRTVECSVRRLDEQERTVVIINTSALDSYRTEIIPKGGDLKQYKKNPVVLINHDRFLVAGNSKVRLRRGGGDGDVLVATMEDKDWDMDDPEIVKWYNKVKRGFVRAASIGFIPLVVKRFLIDPEGEDTWDNWKWVIEKWTLKEWSWVSVPSNYEALVEQRQADLHLQRFESQLSDLRRQLSDVKEMLATALAFGDTSAIDAMAKGRQAGEPEDADAEAAEDPEGDRAAPASAATVPSEPAAENRSAQLDPDAIVRAVQSALSPETIGVAVIAAVQEMRDADLRARGKA